MRTDKTVTGLSVVLRDIFLPDTINRYTIGNVKISSDFKLYDESIPTYLHNRPQWFIKHCMQRLHAAKIGFCVGDVQKLTVSSFLVKGQTFQQDSKERNIYKVFLGSDDQFPTCECVDFKQHCLPCKHIFAIFKVVPGYSWNSLPACFSNSPLFSLDESVFSTDQKQNLVYNVCASPVCQNGMEVNDQMNDYEVSLLEVTEGTTDPDHELPSPKEFQISLPTSTAVQGEQKAIDPLAISLRSKLQLLQDFSYLCKDKASLATVNNCVESAVHAANSLLKREGGLVLQPTPEKRRKVSKETTDKLRCLPSRKRKKRLSLFDRYKKRVGKFADSVKAGSQITIQPEGTSVSKSSLKLAKKRSIVHKYHNLSKEKSRGKAKAIKEKVNIKKENFTKQDVQVIGTYMQCTVDPYKKRVMTETDFEILSSGNWLNDTIVNCTQNCLCKQFHSPGLYDTSLGPHLTYPKAQLFHQILHDSNHWILISTISTPPPTVMVFDSGFHGQISPCVQKQTASILRILVSKMIFSVQPVQQQTNSDDCGVFAIAFLVELLFGGDPTTVKFDVGKMRSHLYSCLQSGKFDHPFPKIEGKHEHSLPYKLLLEVPVYCVCRMPHFEGDDEVRELQMADCDRCHQWYHRSCLAVPDYVFKQKNKFWFCSKC